MRRQLGVVIVRLVMVMVIPAHRIEARAGAARAIVVIGLRRAEEVARGKRVRQRTTPTILLLLASVVGVGVAIVRRRGHIVLLLGRTAPLRGLLALRARWRTDAVPATLVPVERVCPAKVASAGADPFFVHVVRPQVPAQIVGAHKELAAEAVRALVLSVVEMCLDVRFAVLLALEELAAGLFLARVLTCLDPFADEPLIALRNRRTRRGIRGTCRGRLHFSDEFGDLLWFDVGLDPVLLHVSVRQAHDTVDAGQ